ncbi:MAG: hypothetical protein GW947_01810 [Candidatus Pacebacteria bacterium]|nr:hypothetical protein [Candidatus Paceibacterota bacterium]PIR61211.1 MAG: hypothetical protein COU68_00615 [Candidatus Pacebacteria bacterium CG10_big_fil_rev_8_21_14_0_10_45_6]
MAYFNSLHYNDVVLKKLVVLDVFFVFSFVITKQAVALEVDVSKGVISVYKNSVLGESDSGERKEEVQDTKREQILSRQKQSIRVEKSGDHTEIEIKPTVPQAQKTKEKLEQVKKVEQLQTDRLEMKFEPSVLQEKRQEMEKEFNAKIEEVHKERVERKTELEKVKLESRDVDGGHRLELESRQIKATIPEGLRFELNSETNEITLTTPSGEQKTLNHLPDQAIARMQEVGLFDNGAEPIEVAVNSDTQQLEYRQKVGVTKRLFGFFKRSVPAEIILNDETGEVREEVQATGFEKFLNSLSF